MEPFSPKAVSAAISSHSECIHLIMKILNVLSQHHFSGMKRKSRLAMKQAGLLLFLLVGFTAGCNNTSEDGGAEAVQEEAPVKTEAIIEDSEELEKQAEQLNQDVEQFSKEIE